MYKPGKLTVLLNESNTVLNTGLRNKSGGAITLHPRKGRNFFDIEDECHKDTIDAFLTRLEEWTSAGVISWHPKGSRPKRGVADRFALPAAGETKTAPPNEFDDAINDLNKKQAKEEEKTRVQQSGQDRRGTEPTPGAYGEPGGVTSSRAADPEKHEIDAGRMGTSTDPFENWGVGKILEHAVKFDVVTKSGNYFKFDDESLGQGFKKACSRLEQDAELMESVKTRLPAPQ